LKHPLDNSEITGNPEVIAGQKSASGESPLTYRQFDQVALYLMAEVTQCHNSDARDVLYGAGAESVADYLRTYNRPVKLC
jgi:hypothetical protein